MIELSKLYTEIEAAVNISKAANDLYGATYDTTTLVIGLVWISTGVNMVELLETAKKVSATGTYEGVSNFGVPFGTNGE